MKQVSEKQLKANRRNSQLSTGPKTVVGRRTTSKNSIKHGLLSNKGVLECESESLFDKMSGSIMSDLNPVGIVEEELVQQITSTLWRLRRIRLIETGIFEWETSGLLAQRATEISQEYVVSVFETDAFGTTITNQAAYASAKNMSLAEHAKQYAPLPLLARAFIQDNGVDSFTKLSRYESALQRMLYRNLDMLKKLQAERVVCSANGSNENGFVS